MSALHNIVNWAHDTFKDNFWILQIFLVVLFTLTLRLVENAFYNRLHKRFKETKNFWDETLLEALHRPLGLLIWLLGISLAADIAASAAERAVIFKIVDPTRKIGVLLLVVWFLLRFIKKGAENYIESHDKGKGVDKTTVHAVSQLLKVSVLITGTLVGMQMFNLPISGLLAFGGIGGAAVAFAARDLLANFFGGLMIYLDRPFSVGDWIRSPDRNIEGTVEYIGWRLTRIRTFDKRPLYIPNGIFSTISVENPSRMKNRRIKTNIGLRYDDATKIDMILKDIETMLREHEEIDTKQTLMVNLIEFGASSLNFMIYTFTKTTNWVKFQAIQQDVFLKAIAIIEKHGAECAFPTQTVHVPEGLAIQQSVQGNA